MCLTRSSLQTWRDTYPTSHAIPDADMDVALQMYSNLWPTLDHSRHYCLNPLILAAELLEHAGVGLYPNVKRFKGEKGRRYKDTIEQMILTGTTHGIVFNGTTVVDLDSR